MRPVYHLATAAGMAGPLYIYSHSWPVTACFTVAAVAMDVDHLMDHILWSKRPLTLKTFFKKGNALKWSRIIFMFHGYEWMVLMALLANWRSSPGIWALTAGMFMHLLMDEIGNRLPSQPMRIHLPFYLFFYRLGRGFRVERMCDLREKNVSGRPLKEGGKKLSSGGRKEITPIKPRP